MSIPKKIFKHLITPAYPYPLDNGQGTIVWPFKEGEAYVVIGGRFERDEAVVVLEDLPAIISLAKMGYFGLASTKEMNYHFAREAMIRSGKGSKVSVLTLGSYEAVEFDIPRALESFSLDMNHAIDQIKSDTKGEQATNSEPPSVPKLTSLKLLLEEAYFLSYVFGLLMVELPGDKTAQLNLDRLWSLSCETINAKHAEEFACRYAAYHYFRSKGWVVRAGEKFGSDWVLYKEGPSFYHALYAVVLRWRRGTAGELQHCRPTSWPELSCLTRMLHNAQKTLVYAIVTVPESMSTETIKTGGPGCIQQFVVELLEAKRNNVLRRTMDGQTNVLNVPDNKVDRFGEVRRYYDHLMEHLIWARSWVISSVRGKVHS